MTLIFDLSSLKVKDVRRQSMDRCRTFWSLLEVNRAILWDGRTDPQRDAQQNSTNSSVVTWTDKHFTQQRQLLLRPRPRRRQRVRSSALVMFRRRRRDAVAASAVTSRRGTGQRASERPSMSDEIHASLLIPTDSTEIEFRPSASNTRESFAH